MRIFGIDPGTRVLGYGVIETAAARPRLLECGVLRAAARHDLPRRLADIARGLRPLLARVRPDAVAIERAFHGVNSAALIALGEGRGVALLCAAELDLPIHEYAPAEVKKAVTGRGGARKVQVAEMVRALLGCAIEGGLDVTDALAIALCHQQRSHLGVLRESGAEAPAAALLRAVGGRVRRGRGR